jgi:hypothetical protein
MAQGTKFHVIRIEQRNRFNAYGEPTNAPIDPHAERVVRYLTSTQDWSISMAQAVALTMAQAQVHARVHHGDILEAW